MLLTKFSQVVVVVFAIAWTLPVAAQTYTVLYSFTGGADGALPIGGLTLDSQGNLYGTAACTFTLFGGSPAGTTTGSVFTITAAGKFKLLYNFGSGGTNGAWPVAGLVRDSAGNLYGATAGGGTANQGTVFKLDSHGSFTTLHNFSGGKDGAQPLTSMILDAGGNLYGTTYLGGSPGCNLQKYSACGSVFEINAKSKEKILMRLSNWRKYGDFPYGPLMLDSAGNLFGTASLKRPRGLWNDI
jgi:uncharacterized repeat protein (TIGR03803 family)